MAHKTPYELRFNMLDLAYRIAEQNVRAESVQTQIKEGIPHKDLTMYDAEKIEVDEIIKMAAKLNDFVSHGK